MSRQGEIDKQLQTQTKINRKPKFYVAHISYCNVDCNRGFALAGQHLYPDGWQDQEHPQCGCGHLCSDLAVVRLWNHQSRQRHSSAQDSLNRGGTNDWLGELVCEMEEKPVDIIGGQ